MNKYWDETLRRVDIMLVGALALTASAVGCVGGEYEGDEVAGDDVAADEAENDEPAAEIAQTEQALWGYSYNTSSCSDPTGTDSVLAALAVATASELRRWQPTQDFYVSGGTLQLTSTGKKRCTDGVCFNTQALLDMQKSYSSIEVRPGVKVSPTILKLRLTYNHGQQAKCTASWWNPCTAPAHEFRFLHSEPGSCDMNYWFEVVAPSGAPLTSGLNDLMDKLIWVDIEDNSYIKFQSQGATVSIDPTYGLNEVASSSAGSCSAACTKISSTSVSGQCCSCNGTKTYKRSAFNANAYLCQ